MQFSKVDCVNKDLLQRLKSHLTKSYKIGEYQIVRKDHDLIDIVTDVDDTTLDNRATNSDCIICKKDFKSLELP